MNLVKLTGITDVNTQNEAKCYMKKIFNQIFVKILTKADVIINSVY